jgi:CPA1 family monovalent cation:H+ antiporter
VRRIALPAPSLLVLAGLAVGLLPGVPIVRVGPDVVLLGALPPLLFTAAADLDVPTVRAVWRPVVLLATALVVATAAATALVAHAVAPQLAAAPAVVLGAILASTDPVAVTALSRRLRLPARLRALVEAESLFNDATSLVLFQLAVAVVVAGHSDAGDVGVRFLRLAGGGAAIGVLAGAAGRRLTRLPYAGLVLAYAAALAAQLAGASAVTAVIAAGLLARQPSHDRAGGLAVERTLEYAVFALVGLELAGLLQRLPTGQTSRIVELVASVTAALLVVRAGALVMCAALPATWWGRTERLSRGRRWRSVVVVTWSGARGAVPLVAVLAVPTSVDGGAAFPHRALLLTVATAIVVISVVVQGATLHPLVERLGLTEGGAGSVRDVQSELDAVGDDLLPGRAAEVEGVDD